METITTEIARAALVTAIAQKGEAYVYEQIDGVCYYNVDGKPSCLVGTAVAALGEDYFDLLSAEEAVRVENGDGLAAHEIKSIPMTSQAKSALQAAQSTQDGGASWGDALEAFDFAVSHGY